MTEAIICCRRTPAQEELKPYEATRCKVVLSKLNKVNLWHHAEFSFLEDPQNQAPVAKTSLVQAGQELGALGA